MMDSQRQPHLPLGHAYILNPSPLSGPPISASHPYPASNPSPPASPRSHQQLFNTSDTPRLSQSLTNAPSPYVNGNTTSSPQTPRRRAQVEDILNPVHQEVIVSKPSPQPPLQQPPQQQTQPPTNINLSVPNTLTVPPLSDTAITITTSTSSSTVSSSKSTPASPLKHPLPNPPKSIRLHVPLNGATNVYINFASLAEKTYGPQIFDSKRVLGPQGFASSFLNHDRILDTGSDSEAEDDEERTSEKEMTDSVVGDAAKKVVKKKRRRRQNVADRYDVEDPFIDDSEALMEQVAAASKDGFFVYSGLLIAEGERAKIDKYSPFLQTLCFRTFIFLCF
jgi:HPC2 and ubinuclein domain